VSVLRKALIISILSFAAILLRAQTFDFFSEEAYLKNPNHIEFGLGVTNFLGDLGGKDAVGTNDFRDLEFTEFNFGGFVGYRHAFFNNIYGRVDLSYGRVSGDDKLTKEVFRNNRNLSFRSDIFEVDLMGEFFMRIGAKKGHQYKLKVEDSEANPWHVRGSYLTVFGGLGVFHFNPKTQVQGRWVNLHPLSTEGQGLPGGPEPYKLWQLNIPVGIDYMLRIHRLWSFGIEATYRYTFTDYIDDVSTSYYDPNEIALYVGEQNGDVAAYLSNPSLGLHNEGKPPYVTSVGQQRGDESDNDGYFYVMFKVDYLILSDNVKTRKKSGSHFKKKTRTTI
jgi:hypothetical protein